MKIKILVLITITVWAHQGTMNAQVPIGKVVDSYIQGTTTQMLIEVNRFLNTSQVVYLHGGIPITIREAMSISEKQGINYYRAYSNDKLRVLPGENVFLESLAKSEKLSRFERAAIFMKKRYGTVTLVEGDKALINRGSLHNVDKRDVYQVVDKVGRPKGQVELYGIGDFVSGGRIQHLFEYGGSRTAIAEGDSVEYVGNRKILGFGFMAGRAFVQSEKPGGRHVYIAGGGLLWSVFFRKGWSAEWLWGTAVKTSYPDHEKQLHASIFSPLWVKKNFYHPKDISPFLLAGLINYKTSYNQSSNILKQKKGYLPFVGIGLELFSGRLFHLRWDAHYYSTPALEYQGNRIRTQGLYGYFGASACW